MARPKLIGPRLKHRGFSSQRAYDATYRDKHGPRIWTAVQHARNIESIRAWYKEHKNDPAYVFSKRVSKLKLAQKFTLADFNAMLSAQGHRCGLCRRLFTDVLIPMIDHSHEEHRVRNLLCNDCNSGLGFFRESEEVLQAAIQYLRTHHPERVRGTACGL